jgi:uncharacterized membrane protein
MNEETPLSDPVTPPVVPGVPVGLGTILGIVAAVLGALATALTTVLDGYHGEETKLFAAVTTAVIVMTQAGRFLQAAAALFGTGKERVTMERDARSERARNR